MDAPKAMELRELFAQHRWALALDKVPHSALNGKPQKISVSEPQAWTTYELAATWAKRYGGRVGLLLGGEVLEGWILAGIDVDWKNSNRPAHVLPPEVEAFFEGWLSYTYAEWSVSGKGIHLLGIVPKGHAIGRREVLITDDITAEIYAYADTGGRQFVCTFRRLNNAPERLADITALIQGMLPQAPAQRRRFDPDAALEEVRSAPQGTRHNTLVKVAGMFAARGALPRYAEALRKAALEAGLPPREVDKVLRDAAQWNEKAQSEAERIGLTEAALAEMLHKAIGGGVLYAEYRGAYVWDGTRWLRDGDKARLVEAYISLIADLIANLAHTASADTLKALAGRKSAVWGKRVAETMLMHPYTRKVWADRHFDATPGVLNTPSGVVELDTGRLLPHDPDLLCTKLTNAPYRPDLLGKAAAPTWLRFLDDIFCGDKELIAWVQKAVGASAWGDPRDHVLFILWGAGANGKSTFINTLAYVLGDYAGSIAVEVLLGDKGTQTERLNAQLYGLRFAFAAETREDQPLNESRVKALTGGDPIYARYLYQEGFRFMPTHMLWLSTNHKPRVRATDYGTWRRIRLIPFTQQFRGDKADPHLPDKLRAEAEGILAWIVEGARRWRAEGLGDPPAVVAQATEEYRRENDPLEEWITECCETALRATAPAKALYESYCKWAEAQGEKPLSQNAWGRRMTEKGFSADIQPGGVRVRKGIRLKTQ
ncbi:MAG: phage/plasmid primase, P4 family [Nanopusillaceae archaeon]